MIVRPLATLLIMPCLVSAGCSYRFVDPFPASEYALAAVSNSTPEAGLAAMVEEELERLGGFRADSAKRLSVSVARFAETVGAVSSAGTPLRQKLVLEAAWKVEGGGPDAFGSVTADKTYPYSPDPVTLDWNRGAALRLLAEKTARGIFEDIGARP